MARLYGDENFDVHTIEVLSNLGHDTLTARDAGKSNQRIPDHEVLSFATENNRAVVTFNRREYFHLHKANPAHGGIIACTYDADSNALAERINGAIETENDNLSNKLIRVYRPNV